MAVLQMQKGKYLRTEKRQKSHFGKNTGYGSHGGVPDPIGYGWP